jgi:hypothetical protein
LIVVVKKKKKKKKGASQVAMLGTSSSNATRNNNVKESLGRRGQMHQQQTVMELANFVSILTSGNFRQRNVGVTPGTLCRSEVPSLFSPL